MPKWVNSTRQAYLVELWNEYGNKCRYGHVNCSNPSHYAFSKSRLDNEITGKDVKCFDSSGNIINDRFGNPALRHTIEIKKQKIDYRVVYQTSDNDGIIRYLNDYDIRTQNCIKNWVKADRDQSQADYRFEFELRHHNLSDRQFPLYGQFSGIAQDIYFDNQPVFRIESIGIDGITFRSIAKVRLTCDNTYLYVDIHEAMQSVSKNARRKATRQNKISQSVLLKIDNTIHNAVNHYLRH